MIPSKQYGVQENDSLISQNATPGSSTSYGTIGSFTHDHTTDNEDIRPTAKLIDDRIIAHRAKHDERHGESFDDVPLEKRQLGLLSATSLIFNFIIGTGIYATPSVILQSSGSVGVAFIMWLLGALIAVAGTVVYIELGTGLPRSGGEKNYLEFIYRRPKFLITCVYTMYTLMMRTATSNGVVFGEYVMHSLGVTPSPYNTRVLAFCCLTFVVLIHGTTLKWGIRLQTALGIFKLLVLFAISITGLLCLAGVPGFEVKEGYEKPRNFEWKYFWEGSGTGVNAFVTGLYNVIWSFIGYSNANYALSEVQNPVRTLKRAAPLAMFLVTAVYLFINVAYFAAVSKSDILNSRRIVAALFFRNLFGPAAETLLSVFVALSVLGNILSGQFAQGRVIQELGREGILPFSAFFSSNKPFNAPLAGLFAQYLVSCLLLLVTPTGDLYLFLLSLTSYCLCIVNTLVSFGLLLLYMPAYRVWQWDPPFHAPKSIIVMFFVSNIFLVVVPFIPPVDGQTSYEILPYWSHVVAGFMVSLVGYVYWYWFAVWQPRRKGYQLEREWVLQDDGISRYAFQRVPIEDSSIRQRRVTMSP
ncbi:hypothetical protein AX17_005668 [Amanita inopinata Kibby_2008]|nr:hypothetical protein AX17_005668 [Amanita inopinata Kibby_2008]